MDYPGGKGQLFKKIINLMPPHEVYIETHLGGGAVIFNKRPAKHNIGIELDRKVIDVWTNRDQVDVELIHGDAVNYLRAYPFKGKELVYCDPPYLRETRKNRARLYKYEYTLKQHIELLEVIKRLPCMVIISGYESSLYMDYLKDWHTRSFKASCQHGVAIEWLWMNYSTPVELHDYSHLGNNFRERERIKKKLKGWVSRVKSMPVLERQALLFELRSVSMEETLQ